MLAGAWRSPADYVAFYWLNIPVHSGYDVLMYESMDGWMDDSTLYLGSNISICVIICQHQSIYLWIDTIYMSMDRYIRLEISNRNSDFNISARNSESKIEITISLQKLQNGY